MFSRLSLMMLLMVASLSSYCQYPVVKTIGKDTVVIMTLKQGEDINKQFVSLNDSLSTLNKNLLELRQTIGSLGAKNIQLSTNLVKSMDETGVASKSATMYRNSYEAAEAEIRLIKREHKNITVGLLVLLGIWTASISILLNQ